MAVNIKYFSIKTFGGAGATFCAYDGTSALHTISDTKVDGFFNPKSRDLVAGALIMCNCLDGNTMYVVANTPSFDGLGNPISNIMIEDYSVAATIGQKAACEAGTTTNITLSGLQTIDGYTTLANDRVLVKNQTLAKDNGIYNVKAGAWTRSSDCDNYSKVVYSSVYVGNGTFNIHTGWVFTNHDGGTMGVTSILVTELGAASAIGDYKNSAKSANHAGWLLCNGSAVSRTVYASLFSIVGTAFGVGDGSTTFNLPDPRGRSLGSIGSGVGLTARTLGASVGTETQTLTIANLPAHSHGIVGDSGSGIGGSTTDDRILINTDGAVRNVFVKETETIGSGTAHNNMQPTLFVGNLFIYTGS